MTAPTDFDSRLRREAMAWLTVRTNDGADSISSEELREFAIDGRRFLLMDRQRGIRKPAELSAALSIRTVYAPSAEKRPYDDDVGEDGLLRYKWRGDDAGQAENRALRAAMEQRVPLIWFFGVGQARYQPIFPIFLVAEERDHHQFVVDLDVVRDLAVPASPLEGQLRRYVMRETRQRLHQPVFRASVLRAYETRCAVCSLRHSELLDAAHYRSRPRRGRHCPRCETEWRCARSTMPPMTASFLGVRPDLVVEIRADLLAEIDGPMLQHGLKERHGQQLMVLPRGRVEQPDPHLLEISYARFRKAG